MRRATSCVLRVLVVLAGCSGLVGEDSDRAVTVTPAPIPEPSPQYPPGVAAEGVTDPTMLASAHRSGLTNTSFTRWTNRTVRYPNGTVYQQSNQASRIGADGRPRVRVERDRRRFSSSRPGGRDGNSGLAKNEDRAQRPIPMGRRCVGIAPASEESAGNR